MVVRPLLAPGVGTSATALTLDTPAQATPNARIILTGTYQGSPQALDYNLGAGWVQATNTSFSAGVFTITVPAGVAAGSYTPQIRDHVTPSITATAGTFVVDPWTPAKLATSPGAAAVFEFNANNPTVAAVASDSTVHSVLNSLNPNQSLTAEVATGGNGIVIAHGSGADGKRRLLKFHSTTTDAGRYDPSTNWLGAGGVSGTAGSALVGLANSSNLGTSGAFTAIIALQIDKSYAYEAGPIWGSLGSPGPLHYSQIRYNNGSGFGGAQVVDQFGGNGTAQSTITAGWHVMTMIKTGTSLTYRLDGQLVATVTVNSAQSFTANDFMLGGGFPPPSSPDVGRENGVPPPYVGEFQAYSGALAGTDLANAEKLAGNSIGLTLNPNVSRLVQVTDTTTGQTSSVAGTPYGGAVAGLQNEYINLTTDNLNLSVNTPGWFIHGGAGDDTISVSSGTNVLAGGSGTNLLVGGSGTDTFFVDDRSAVAAVWSTAVNVHTGDAAVIWGVTPADFTYTWQDGQGAAGHTGLTLHVAAAGKSTASLTLAGYSQADLSDGRLSTVFGPGQAGGTPYLYIHANS